MWGRWYFEPGGLHDRHSGATARALADPAGLGADQFGRAGHATLSNVRVWLEVQGDQKRVLSADTSIDPAVLKSVGETPIGPLRPTVARVASVLWLIWTLALSIVAVQVYVRAASLEANNFRFNAALGAWLLWSGAVVIRPRGWRAGLVIISWLIWPRWPSVHCFGRQIERDMSLKMPNLKR